MKLSNLTHTPLVCRLLAAGLLVILSASGARLAVAEDASAVEGRLTESAKYLSSDELEGRGVGTKGLDLAADFIAKQFREAGLKTDWYDGTPFQKFKMTTGATLGQPNRLTLVGPTADGKEPTRLELKMGEQFNPLALGGSGSFDLPLVFVGYGITGKDEKYDDYAGIDVKDKAVVLLRHEPEQANPHSAFDGTKNSQHATYRRKISNAYEHGAAAVIFCNDEFDIRKSVEAIRKRWQAAIDQLADENVKFKAIAKPSADEWKKHEEQAQASAEEIQKFATQLRNAHDPLLPFDGGGPGGSEGGRSFPVLFCRRAALEPMFQSALSKTLGQLEGEIDKGPTPRSAALDRLAGRR